MDVKRPPQPLKLKDSCDMCSASKVKCNKEKPTCSRCKKLGYPCFYSPARRLGRPHPSSKATSPKDTKESATSPGVASPRGSKHGDDDSDSIFSPREPQNTREKRTTQAPAPNTTIIEQPTTYTFQASSPLPESPIAFKGHANARKESLRVLNSIKDTRSNHQSNTNTFRSRTGKDLTAFDDFKFNFSASPRERSIKQSPASTTRTSSVDSQVFQEQTSPQSVRTTASTFSSNANTDQPPFLEPGTTIHNTSDCLTTAIEILHKLNRITHQRQHSPNPGISPTLPTLTQLLTTISHTTPLLIPILTCPCSQNPEVGLLIAAVCSSLLQIYGIILRDSKIQCDEKGNGICIDGGCGGGGAEGVTIVKVLGELPRVASLIMGFERRYVGVGGGEVLATLGKGLRGTLRGMSREATNWLADV